MFSSNREGPLNLYRSPIGQPEKAERLAPSANNQIATSWTPSGDGLVYYEFNPGNGSDIWMLDLARDRKAIPLVKTLFDESQAHVSPDGKWLAYTSTETGRGEVYVQPFPGPGPKVRTSTQGGSRPRWISASSLTYLYAGRVMEVKWNGQASTPAPYLPASQPVATYDVAPDGRLLLLEQRTDPTRPATLQLIVNWAAGLK